MMINWFLVMVMISTLWTVSIKLQAFFYIKSNPSFRNVYPRTNVIVQFLIKQRSLLHVYPMSQSMNFPCIIILLINWLI